MPFSQFVVVAACSMMAACNNDSNSSNNINADDLVDTSTDTVILTNSDVDFSNCREIAGGISVARTSLQEQVPTEVSVNSLTEMGFVFEGSDDLGMLIVRAINCEAISVTDSEGNVTSDENIAFVHVGAPISVANLPATTFSNDGVNGADFNIYTLSYQTSSLSYFGAMERAGLQNATFNEAIVNELIDLDADQCSTASLLVSVPGDSEFSLSITGEVVEATAECHPGGSDFVANWWSVDEQKQVSALSNIVFNQTFTETAGPNVLVIAPEGRMLSNIIGATHSRFTGFSGSGYLPSGGLGDRDMVAETLGELIN